MSTQNPRNARRTTRQRLGTGQRNLRNLCCRQLFVRHGLQAHGTMEAISAGPSRASAPLNRHYLRTIQSVDFRPNNSHNLIRQNGVSMPLDQFFGIPYPSGKLQLTQTQILRRLVVTPRAICPTGVQSIKYGRIDHRCSRYLRPPIAPAKARLLGTCPGSRGRRICYHNLASSGPTPA